MPTEKWFDRVLGSETSMDDDERYRRRAALVEPATITPGRISSPRALQHLQEGFNRRVYMIEASFLFLTHKASEAGGKPVSAYTATDLAIHLNAFYLNLCGALDNLAWALQYTHELVPGADEKNKKRLQISLFGDAFLKALQTKAPQLTATIREHESWNKDLRDLRDPGAHRIPIYAIRGVANQEDADKFKQLQDQATRLMESGEHEKGMDLMFESQNIGSYQPLMALSHESGHEIRGIVRQVSEDDEKFVAISEAVLGHLFSAPSRSTTASR